MLNGGDFLLFPSAVVPEQKPQLASSMGAVSRGLESSSECTTQVAGLQCTCMEVRIDQGANIRPSHFSNFTTHHA